MSHLMAGGIGHTRHHNRFICKQCLTGFKSAEKLEKHKVICTDKGFVQRCVFPTEENKMPQFKNYKNKWLIPVVIYADVECKLEESDEENVISKHTPISIAYSVPSTDPKWQRDCWVYKGVDCVQQFLLSLDKLKLELAGVMHLQLLMKPLSHVQQEHHINATRCYLCQKQFNENEETSRKHPDHCHITGEYCGPACQYCNMKNLSLKGDELLTAKVHLLKEEDDGGEDIGKKYDITKLNYQFKDSFAFMSSSLATFASNLEKRDLVSVYKFVQN